MEQGWRLIRRGVKTEDPHPAGKYLGCSHSIITIHLPDGADPLQGVEGGVPQRPTQLSGRPTRYMLYCMSDFLLQCVDLYVELADKQKCTLRKVETPFVDEGKPEDSFGAAGKTGEDIEVGAFKAYRSTSAHEGALRGQNVQI